MNSTALDIVNPKHPGGRPTKYTPELIIKAKQYVEDGYGIFPSIAGMCCELDISRECAYDLAKQHQEFSDILETISRKQERLLLEKGLNSEYNSTISKLVLTKHGYSDKTETKLDIDMTGLSDEQLEIRLRQQAAALGLTISGQVIDSDSDN